MSNTKEWHFLPIDGIQAKNSTGIGQWEPPAPIEWAC